MFSNISQQNSIDIDFINFEFKSVEEQSQVITNGIDGSFDKFSLLPNDTDIPFEIDIHQNSLNSNLYIQPNVSDQNNVSTFELLQNEVPNFNADLNISTNFFMTNSLFNYDEDNIPIISEIIDSLNLSSHQEHSTQIENDNRTNFFHNEINYSFIESKYQNDSKKHGIESIQPTKSVAAKKNNDRKNKNIEKMIEMAREARMTNNANYKYLKPSSGTLEFCDLKKYQNLQKKKSLNFQLLEEAIKDPSIKVRFFGNTLTRKDSEEYGELNKKSSKAVLKHRGSSE